MSNGDKTSNENNVPVTNFEGLSNQIQDLKEFLTKKVNWLIHDNEEYPDDRIETGKIEDDSLKNKLSKLEQLEELKTLLDNIRKSTLKAVDVEYALDGRLGNEFKTKFSTLENNYVSKKDLQSMLDSKEEQFKKDLQQMFEENATETKTSFALFTSKKEAEKEIATLKENLSKAKASSDHYKKLYVDKDGLLTNEKEKTKNLEEDKTQIEKEKNQLESDKRLLESDKRLLESDKGQLESDKSRLTSDNKNLTSSASNYRMLLKEEERKTKKLETTISGLETDIDVLNQKVTDLTESKEKTEGKMERAMDALGKITTDGSYLGMKVDKVLEVYDGLTNKIKDLQGQLQTEKGKVTESRGELKATAQKFSGFDKLVVPYVALAQKVQAAASTKVLLSQCSPVDGAHPDNIVKFISFVGGERGFAVEVYNAMRKYQSEHKKGMEKADVEIVGALNQFYRDRDNIEFDVMVTPAEDERFNHKNVQDLEKPANTRFRQYTTVYVPAIMKDESTVSFQAVVKGKS